LRRAIGRIADRLRHRSDGGGPAPQRPAPGVRTAV